MGDADRSGTSHELMEANIDLKIKHYEIMLSEKRNQAAQLELDIERKKTVEMKKLELAKDYAQKQIENIEAELNKLKLKANSIDVTEDSKK